MADADLDFLLEKMEQLINRNNPLICFEKELMVCMQFLRRFLVDSLEARSEHEEVGDLVTKIRYVTREIDDIVDSYILLDLVQREAGVCGIVSIEDVEVNSNFGFKFSTEEQEMIMKDIRSFAEKRLGDGFGGVMKEINSTETKAREIYEKNMYDIRVRQAPKSSHGASTVASASSRATGPVVDEEILVGMDDVITDIREQLVAEHDQHLKVIPIIGMAGLGKTTLAKKLYSDPFIVYSFHVRAWACVSQDYQKRDVLLSIFRSARLVRSLDQIEGKGEEELGEQLYKSLKGRKYLIVMDDVWDIEAWTDLKRYFPEDNNGSRAVFTSRHVHMAVAVHAKPQNLRFLNKQESWDLLQRKAFGKESCPPELVGIGKKIAKKCRGLPLAILVVTGLLAKSDKTLEWWSHVADSVSSNIVSEPEEYMATLGLSYNYLPFHLKPCFLYFGAFPEDHEIQVQNLIWLWIAEGFIRKNEQKSLEEAAEDYLRDLIDRSLVITSKRRCDGGIKTIYVHDLLRDLCLRKAEEEEFLLLISRFEHIFPSPSSSHMLSKSRRFSVHSQLQHHYGYLKRYALHARSLLCFQNEYTCTVPSICGDFKLLRVLDLSPVSFCVPAREIGFLVHLRYLALGAIDMDLLQSISNLWNLETFIADGSLLDINMPQGIWKMVKLRHLYIKRCFTIPSPPKDGYPFILENLQSINGASLLNGCERDLEYIPNIRKLKCYLEKSMDGSIHFPKLDFLCQLEKLRVRNGDSNYPVNEHFLTDRVLTLPHVEEFPTNLKCLTLSRLGLPWEKMSIIGRLPNLEVLKLSYGAFMGPRWDTRDGEFCKLRYLKLDCINVRQWHSSGDHFTNLERLVLNRLFKLKEIPSELGDILTLEAIELWLCSKSAENSAREIDNQQQSMGNNGLKVIIHPGSIDPIDEMIPMVC